MSRRWRYPRSRRGQYYGPPPTAPVTATPAYLPTFTEPAGRSSRLAALRTRRGVYFGVLPQAPVVTPAVWAPGFTEPAGRNARLVAMRVRRGRYTWAPPPAGVVTAPAWVPQFSRQHRQLFGGTRRAHSWAPVPQPVQAPSWIPAYLRAHRPSAPPVARRGRYYAPPVRRPLPPPVLRMPYRRRQLGTLTPRRRRMGWAPFPAGVVVVYHPARGATGVTRNREANAVTRNRPDTAVTRNLRTTAVTRKD